MKGKIIELSLISKYYAFGRYLRLALIRLYLRDWSQSSHAGSVHIYA